MNAASTSKQRAGRGFAGIARLCFVAFAACRSGRERVEPPPIEQAPKVQLDCIQPFVAKTCAVAECHDSVTREHGMDLTTSSSIYDAWVGKNGLDHCLNSLEKRVIPGDPDNSFVMKKVTGNLVCEGTLSRSMPPPPAPPLLPEQIEALRAWIATGAPRECAVSATSGGGGSGGAPQGGATGSTGGSAGSPGSDGGVGAGGTAGEGPGGAAGQGGLGGAGQGGLGGQGGTGGVLDDTFACTAASPCAAGLICFGYDCALPAWECSTHEVIGGTEAGEGGGGGEAEPPRRHPCPGEMAEYCGCDGVTFSALLTCPDRPYQHPGACGDGYNCDPLDSVCAALAPTCPEGQTASVVDRCFSSCVPISECRCEFAFECPSASDYTCTPERRCLQKPVDGGT
jgi:hypothetical protein